MILRSVHQSGNPHASPAQWTAAVKRVTADADVVGWSDAGGRDVSPPGWSQTRTADGCTVAWDTATWKRQASGVYELPVPEYTRGGHRRSTVAVVWALLADDFGATVLRSAAHLPAHVQVGRHYSTSRKPDTIEHVAAHRAALDGLAEMLWTLQREQHPDEWATSFDFNVDLGMKVWRDVIHAAVEPTDLRLVVPPRPTFAKRKIDAHLTTLRAVDNETLPKMFGADEHSGAYAELTTQKETP